VDFLTNRLTSLTESSSIFSGMNGKEKIKNRESIGNR
jgi:hypothetical protein